MERNYWSAWILCGIIFIVFLLEQFYPSMASDYALDLGRMNNEPWLLITSMFIHGSSLHLLGNVFALGVFGLLAEQQLGTRKFLLLYFSAGVAAGLLGAYFYPSLIGASGAIFGAIGALAVMKPRMYVWTYGVPMPMIIAAGFWLLLDVGGVFYPSNIANISHIVGLLFGVVFGFAFRKPEPRKQKRVRSLSDDQFNRWEDDWFGLKRCFRG